MSTLLDEIIAETFGEWEETPWPGGQQLIYDPGRGYGWQKELHEVTEADKTQNLIDQGIRNENALTDRIFYNRHPALSGQKLIPGTALAQEWITIRNLTVRPKLAAVPLVFNKSFPRLCCVLSPLLPLINLTGDLIFASQSIILDPANLGPHQGADETIGIVYTGGAGFIDLGHLREECDLTEFVWTRLQGAGGAVTEIETVNGKAKIIRQVPPDKWLTVAQAIAFDDGLGHEIDSYNVHQFGQHQSSFSPEDLCSDFLGTIVARRAIGKGGPFAAQVTTELNLVLKALRVQTPAETLKALNLVDNRWFKFEGPGSVKDDYLRRRNFTRVPCKAGHPSDFPTPGWVVASLGDAASFYTFETSAGTKKEDFNDKIQQIRNDAIIRYGPDFDKC